MKTLGVALAAALTLTACASRDVRTDLQIVDVQSGWQDVSESGSPTIKIVPAIAFKLKNISAEPISGVQITAVFRRDKDPANVDDPFVRAIGAATPLAAGATTTAIVMRSKFGFTGTDSRPQLLKHSQFVDFNVTILGKHGRNNWASMGVFQVDRVPMSK